MGNSLWQNFDGPHSGNNLIGTLEGLECILKKRKECKIKEGFYAGQA